MKNPLGFVRAWQAASPPSVGVQLSENHASAVSIARTKRGMSVKEHVIEAFPPGIIFPGLNNRNILKPGCVIETLSRMLDTLELRSRRIGLVIPDSVAKVSLLRFEELPARNADLKELIRWRIKKSVPFQVKDAQISYVPGAVLPEGGQEYIVTVARRDIIEEYEQVCAEVGAHAGLIDLATFGLATLILPPVTPGVSSVSLGAWLVIHVCGNYSSAAIIQDGDLVFFRNKQIDSEEGLRDLVHQTTMYYEDRLKGNIFSKVVLAGFVIDGNGEREQDLASPKQVLENYFKSPVETIDLIQKVALGNEATRNPRILRELAPPIGLLLRGREKRGFFS